MLEQLSKCVATDRSVIRELQKQIDKLQLKKRPQEPKLHRPMAVQHQPEPLQELTVIDSLYSLQKREPHTQLLDQRYKKPIDQESRTREFLDPTQLLVLYA